MTNSVPTSISEEGHPRLRQLPDPKFCSVRAPVGAFDLFATCLVQCPSSCRYVSVYERGYICKLCKHPDWMAFV